jgi:hypothetical protein
MRSRFAAIAAALVLSVSTAAQAEIYTMYTKGTPTAPGSMITPSASNLGLNINLAGIANAVIPLTNVIPGSTTIMDTNLDASNSGTLYITGGNLQLANAVYNVSLGFLGSVVATLNNVQFNVTGAGPIAVTNGNYTITSATPGSLNIYGGNISLVGTVLGQAINAAIDFTTSPVAQAFSGLTQNIPGTVDDDAGNTDTDTDPHTLGGAGLTGISNIDTDGAELFINYNGLSISTTIVSGTLSLPTTITVTGSTRVSVPEAGSIIMVGAAVVGLGVVARRRRSV